MLKVQSLSSRSIVQQKSGNIVSDMDGETVMMSIKNGNYYNLGIMGGQIWNEITTPIMLKNLVEKLTSEYDIENKECETQVIQFLESLYKEDLISVS